MHNELMAAFYVDMLAWWERDLLHCETDLIDLQEEWQISLLSIGSKKSELWSEERLGRRRKILNVDSNAQWARLEITLLHRAECRASWTWFIWLAVKVISTTAGPQCQLIYRSNLCPPQLLLLFGYSLTILQAQAQYCMKNMWYSLKWKIKDDL